MSIGVSYATLMPDHRFTASSIHPNDNGREFLPKHARLRGDKNWEAANRENRNEWLQIDLGSIVYVCAVSTQGSASDNAYTKYFKLAMSLDNSESIWTYYQENGEDKVGI